jgi:hypothetical protein
MTATNRFHSLTDEQLHAGKFQFSGTFAGWPLPNILPHLQLQGTMGISYDEAFVPLAVSEVFMARDVSNMSISIAF